jgi:hypothetical protein
MSFGILRKLLILLGLLTWLAEGGGYEFIY